MLDDAGWTTQTRVVRDDRSPYRIALDAAAEIDASLIVAGAHSTADSTPGSLGRETRSLAHHTSRPLLVLPAAGAAPAAGAPGMLAYDGSPSADHALEQAARVLAPRDSVVATAWEPSAVIAPLTLVGGSPVVSAGYDPQALDERIRSAAEQTAAAGATALGSAGWPAAVPEEVRPAAASGARWSRSPSCVTPRWS